MAGRNTKDNQKDLDEKKIAYLQLIQEPIGRMSTISSVIKGFAAAVIAGIMAISLSDISLCAMIIGAILLMAFMNIDIYYLRLERQYSYLYEQVRLGKMPVNLCLKLQLAKKDRKEARATFGKCLFSKSILLFYIPIWVCVAVLVVFKII